MKMFLSLLQSWDLQEVDKTCNHLLTKKKNRRKWHILSLAASTLWKYIKMIYK